VKAALDEAVAKATGLSGDRLARLREAVKAAGKRAEDVRLVRVFAEEEKVPGAKSVGGFQYLVELLPSNMKQVMKKPERERGGHRGGGRPGGFGGGGPGKAPTTGGFSMDAVKADRANERRGRPGGRSGARRPGGGGGRRGG
jgi:hypothetical protein